MAKVYLYRWKASNVSPAGPDRNLREKEVVSTYGTS